MESMIQSVDPEVAVAIRAEERRQRETLVLIASENYASRAVLEVASSVFTNKYAEGYPDARYYAGCEQADVVENLARERAMRLFRTEHVNVQPHSGSQANMAAFFALLDPGDEVLSMSLDHGGHLTHGSSASFSGKLYRFQFYGVDKDSEVLDYDAILEKALVMKPKLIIAGCSAYSRKLNFERFRQIADATGSLLLADIAHISGLIVAGAHPSPIPHAHISTTTTHKTLRGPRGAIGMANIELAKKYDSAVFPRMQGGPLMHIILAKAVAFKEASEPSFKEYGRQVVSNAKAMAEELKRGGVRLISGGTDNHMILLDMRPMGLSGSETEGILSRAGIIVNKNAIPFDPLPPRIASGVRIGTPALTTRGMREPDIRCVAELMLDALRYKDSDEKLKAVREKVKSFAEQFHVPSF